MARTSRRPTVSAHSGEGRQIGLDDREIPGGLPHLGNTETHETPAKVPAHRTIPSINEHRVADPDPDAPYDDPKAGKVLAPKPPPLPKEQYAVPTYQVQHPGKAPKHYIAYADFITVPGSGSDPIRICAVDYDRYEVQLLNEDAANDMRFSEERDALLEGKGSLLKHGMMSYHKVRTQDWLFALGTTANAVQLSVILVTEINN